MRSQRGAGTNRHRPGGKKEEERGKDLSILPLPVFPIRLEPLGLQREGDRLSLILGRRKKGGEKKKKEIFFLVTPVSTTSPGLPPEIVLQYKAPSSPSPRKKKKRTLAYPIINKTRQSGHRLQKVHSPSQQQEEKKRKKSVFAIGGVLL